MRILAIRGCNLASLAGEFEIDLAHGPLAGAGVFAIVGPTGAGKSTLLDAMCVALFDRTPRLANRSTVVVGRGDDDPAALGAQDVRTLLRRGASAGWAEVDFESGDERQYRARWSVRRARGAIDGALQDQQVTLTAIDGGGRLGGTKMETLRAIHRALGLTFDQFRRSALLAQGEFATFLRAEGKDRSELLERMTGTEIYSKLSIAAHQRAVVAEQQLRERHAAAMAIVVLDEAARSVVETEHGIAQVAREAARVRLASAELAARWRDEAVRRDQALAAAEEGRRSAELAVHDAEPLRAELALRRRAELLRAVWDDAARLDRQLAIARGELAAAIDAATRATAEQQMLVERRAALVQIQTPVRTARIAAGIVERTPPRGDAIGAFDVAQAAAIDAAAWLDARRGLAPEITAWPELDGKLASHRGLADAIAASDATLGAHAGQREVLVARRVARVVERDAALVRLGEATRDAATFQHKRGITLDAAGRQEDEARRTCGELDRLVGIAAGARAAANAMGELDAMGTALETAAAADAERRGLATAERDTAAIVRDERARIVAELRRAAGFEHARAELVAGEHCPLCGATEHPWRDRGAFDVVIGETDAARADAAARFDQAVAALAILDARALQHAADRARLASTRTAIEASVASAVQVWREQLAALGELVLVADPATPAAEELAAERAEVARGKLEAARAARSEAVAASKAIADAQARIQARQADVDHHASGLQELDAALAALDASIERLRGERAGRVERHIELGAELAATIARWAAALPASERERLIDAAPLPGASLPERAAEPRPKKRKRGTPAPDPAAVRDAVGPTPALDPAAVRDELAEITASWRARVETVALADAAVTAALAVLDREMIRIAREVAEHATRHSETTRRCDELLAQLRAAAATLDEARQVAGFDREELRRLLGDEPSRVDVLADQLDTVDRAADRARTLVTERRRLVDDHAAARPGAADDDFADADRLAELSAAVITADHQAAALAASLAADSDARGRRDVALAAFAAAERAAEIDRVLGQMIGSHDGKLFRSFAQSLTLDGLLAVANSHLEELAPRYQLERVPKHDLELQVIDRDLGSEVRSVQSLSGGESFLVSLALALGLSSMSAHDVRVRTLLIDEGFGTLDPTTLDSALAVLDALQATGRQVGIISHVPALVERVGAHVRVAPRGGGRSEVVVPPS